MKNNVLAIRTDKPEAELYLYREGVLKDKILWQADRQLSTTIHTKINQLLEDNELDLNTLSGLIVFKGPGSFTGLRIGITVANGLGYSLNIPVVGATGANWTTVGLEQLKSAKNGKWVVPEYGALPNVTKPKA